MNTKPTKHSKYIVAISGLILGITGFIFTQLWFIFGMGVALCIASLVAGE